MKRRYAYIFAGFFGLIMITSLVMGAMSQNFMVETKSEYFELSLIITNTTSNEIHSEYIGCLELINGVDVENGFNYEQWTNEQLVDKIPDDEMIWDWQIGELTEIPTEICHNSYITELIVNGTGIEFGIGGN